MKSLTASDVELMFKNDPVVEHYARAAIEIGLWRSEELVLQRVFRPENTLLEVGCGAGRLALGLWELGFKQILATDVSREMIVAGRKLAAKLGYSVPMRVANATKLPFEDEMFDGVIFGFNGLMQIPGRESRRAALSEMARVIVPGGRVVLTTHDRSIGAPDGFWREEKARWRDGGRDQRLVEFGDIITPSDYGDIYIHIPTREEMVEDFAATGWILREDAMRSEISEESPAVEQFSVDCRFWVAEKPRVGNQGADRSETR